MIRTLILLALMMPSAAPIRAADAWLLQDQLSHEGRVTGVYEDPTSHRAYSSGEDGHLKVWRTDDGVEIADFTLTPDRKINCFAVNPRDSNEVAVAASDWRSQQNEIIRFNLASGEVVRRWSGSAQSLSYSPDGTFIAGKSFSSITVWHANSGTVFVGLQGANDDTSKLQLIAPQTLVYHVDSGVNFLDLRNGTRIHQIPASDVIDFAVVEKTNRLVTVSRSEYREWDIETGRPQPAVKLALAPSQLTVDPTTQDAFMFFKAAIGFGDTRGPLFHIDGRTHTLEMITGGDPTNLFTATYASNGVLLSGNTVGRMRRWQFADTKLNALPELGITRPAISAMAVSGDSRFLAVGDAGGAVDIWDSENGVRRLFDPNNGRVKPLQPHFGSNGLTGALQEFTVGGRKAAPPVKGIQALTDGSEFAVVFQNGDVRVVSANTLQVRIQDANNDGWASQVFRTSSNILYVVGRTTLARWDLVSGKRLPSVPLPQTVQTYLSATLVGSGLAFPSERGTTLFDPDTATSKELPLRSPFCMVSSAEMIYAVTPTQVMSVSTKDGSVRVVAPWSSNIGTQACVIANKSLVIVGSDGRFAALPIDGAQNTEPKVVQLNFKAASLMASPAGRVLVGDLHGVVHRVDAQSGAEISRLVSWNYDGWALIGSEAKFLAPPEGWPRLVFSRRRQPLVSVDSGLGFERLYRPPLLREMLGSSTSSTIASPSRAAEPIAGSPPTVRIIEPQQTVEISSGGSQGGKASVSSSGTTMGMSSRQAGEPGSTVMAQEPVPAGPIHVKAEAIDSGGGIAQCQLLSNRTVVQFIDNPAVQNGHAIVEAPIKLIPGANEIGFSCFNRQGLGSPRATTVIYAKEYSTPMRRRAYLISIGINDNPIAPLNYATPDARLFIDEIGKSLTSTHRYQSIVPIPLLDAAATHDNILATLKKMGGKPVTPDPSLAPLLAQVQSVEPEDAVFFYFAGHGGMLDGQYKLLTHEYTGSGSRGTVTDAELRDAFANINARDLVLILDSCESGTVLGSPEARVGPFDSASFAQMAYDKGMFVLVATQSLRAAQELQVLGHGLLTHVMLNEGLHDRKAFQAGSSALSVRDFIEYPVKAVPAWQERRRREQAAKGAPPDDGTAALRLLKRAKESYGEIQTPRDFVPPFGFNEAFLISNTP